VLALLLGLARAAEPLATWDFEADDGGLVATGDLGQWRWGQVRRGPGAAFSGERAWAVGLDADYLVDASEFLEIPLPALGATQRPALRWEQWLDLGAGDLGAIEIDDGSGWTQVAPVYGYPSEGGYSGASGGWSSAVVLLSPGTTRARLVFRSDLAKVGAGWFVDDMGVFDGDVAAPRVDALDDLPDTEEVDRAYPVSASARDDREVAWVELRWDDGRGEIATLMTGSGSTWTASIPAQDPATDVSYYVVASDGVLATRFPASGALGFRVALPAPTELSGPAERLVAATVPLTWTAPATTHSVTGYVIYRGSERVLEVDGTTADAPLSGGDDTFSVRALFDLGARGLVEGEASAPWTADAVVPSVLLLDPPEAWAGEVVRVRVDARNCFFVEGDVGLGFGVGASISGVDVLDIDRVVATLALSVDAPLGPRDVRIESGTVVAEAAAGFTVLDAADRPALVSIDPSTVRQGESTEVVIAYSGALAAMPEVSVGDGIVVSSVEDFGGELVLVVSVAPDAEIRQRNVVVDDGVRLVEGVRLSVEDRPRALGGACGVTALPSLVGNLVGLGLAVRRRRA
jgi:hypothetical protein